MTEYEQNAMKWCDAYMLKIKRGAPSKVRSLNKNIFALRMEKNRVVTKALKDSGLIEGKLEDALKRSLLEAMLEDPR